MTRRTPAAEQQLRALAEAAMLAEEAERVECPWCHAPAGSRCVSTLDGEPMRAPHWQRINAAEKQPAP